ncbi:MAG: Hsp70 family protein, partial [Gemmataceae bacterium]
DLERRDFQELIEPLLVRTMECVQKALDDARLTAAQLDRVVLVGGSTRIPMIGERLEERLGQRACRDVHPELCVALGAAVQGAIIAGASVKTVLVDLTAHSLGIKTLEYGMTFQQGPNEHRFTPIIKRNTALPACRSEIFGTVGDEQPTVEIDIYQGESPDVRRNHRIGTFLIEGLARVPAGNQIVVQLDLNLDGMLKVSAKEKSTGHTKQITIQSALARYAVQEREQAEARLARLWGTDPVLGDAAEEETPRVISMAPVEGEADGKAARSALTKIATLEGKVSGEDWAELERLRQQLRTALDARNWPELRTITEETNNLLFYLDDAG